MGLEGSNFISSWQSNLSKFRHNSAIVMQTTKIPSGVIDCCMCTLCSLAADTTIQFMLFEIVILGGDWYVRIFGRRNFSITVGNMEFRGAVYNSGCLLGLAFNF